MNNLVVYESNQQSSYQTTQRTSRQGQLKPKEEQKFVIRESCPSPMDEDEAVNELGKPLNGLDSQQYGV